MEFSTLWKPCLINNQLWYVNVYESGENEMFYMFFIDDKNEIVRMYILHYFDIMQNLGAVYVDNSNKSVGEQLLDTIRANSVDAFNSVNERVMNFNFKVTENTDIIIDMESDDESNRLLNREVVFYVLSSYSDQCSNLNNMINNISKVIHCKDKLQDEPQDQIKIEYPEMVNQPRIYHNNTSFLPFNKKEWIKSQSKSSNQSNLEDPTNLMNKLKNYDYTRPYDNKQINNDNLPRRTTNVSLKRNLDDAFESSRKKREY
ncbi:hypothetical protein TBLA_0E03210 [Henningerozyma blattae CBS 6284]|uniref:Uncharacterized protein n=1 Tax=Henningerozyma blattae (strain ATCC 34711 / CBS 6284 / DSM 70876 / NBRC 10599 / NRRL Y-10934 / UCD 77-7) TaxID=1071380 RepID=I2H4S3_HENB6|nr:hypothetical protein TBLA_0E03210 [Tetrapisispora blattae CBS 6284]CCH61375.1 hypothetical protein TBLA_0E03210 [Tetrapisispora blattae CBS 6284]